MLPNRRACAVAAAACLAATTCWAATPPPPLPRPPSLSCPTAAATLAALAPAWYAILKKAGNGPLLAGTAPLRGGLTLFAPTDAALARAGAVDTAWAPGVAGSPTAPPGSVAALLAAAPAAGAVLISGHAVRGTLRAADLMGGGDRSLQTLATRKLPGRFDEGLMLQAMSGARAPTPLITSAGGVTAALVGPDAGGGCDGRVAIHLVDAVLLPFEPFKGGAGKGGEGG